MRPRWIGILAAVCAFPTGASAQIAWDTPRLIGPDSPGGFGIYWLQSSTIRTDTKALMATWAFPGTGGNVILRGGAALDEDAGPEDSDLVSAFGGIDMRASIARHTDTQPLDVTWHAGVGAGAGVQDEQYIAISLPMGLSVGRAWTSGAVWLAPYVSLGAAFDLNIGDDAPDEEEEFTVTPAADLGLDISFDPSRTFVFRVAASLGDRQALTVGMNLGGGR